MLPWQKPQQEERMPLREKIEWAVIILAIVALWPRIFLPDSPINHNIVYNVLVLGVLPIALIYVLVQRVRRFNRAVREQDPLKDDDRFES
jgi:hypothetical protein